MGGFSLGLSRFSRLLSGGTGVATASVDATGKVYTVPGLKPGSSAILYANGSQTATTTVDSTGKATWTLDNKPAIGTVMTYDGTVTGSAGTVPNPTPAPSFTIQPSISPASGTVGQVFTVADGTITNGSVSARQWNLNGSPISGATGASYTSTAVGNLTCSVTATGSGGTTTATSAAVAVTSTSTPGTVSLSTSIQKAGNAYVFTFIRTGDISTAQSANYSVAGSTLNGATPAVASDFGGSFPSGVVSFAAGQASKTVTITPTTNVEPE